MTFSISNALCISDCNQELFKKDCNQERSTPSLCIHLTVSIDEVQSDFSSLSLCMYLPKFTLYHRASSIQKSGLHHVKWLDSNFFDRCGMGSYVSRVGLVPLSLATFLRQSCGTSSTFSSYVLTLVMQDEFHFVQLRVPLCLTTFLRLSCGMSSTSYILMLVMWDDFHFVQLQTYASRVGQVPLRPTLCLATFFVLFEEAKLVHLN